MQCPKCRSKKQEDNFCSKCGTALKGDAAEAAATTEAKTTEVAAPATNTAATTSEASSSKANSGLATASLICGIVGLCLFWTVFIGMVAGAVGLGLGLAAGKNTNGKPRAGTVISAIALGAGILAIIISMIGAAVFLANDGATLIETLLDGSYNLDGNYKFSAPSFDT